MARGQIEIDIITQGAEKVTSLERSLANVGKEAEKAQKETNQALKNAGDGAERAVKANRDQVKSIDSLKKKFDELTKARNASTDIKQINNYNKELDKTDKQIKKLTGTSDKFGKTITRAFAFIGGATVLKNALDVISEFDQQIADLGAILGKTGDELDFFRQKSIELSTQTRNSSSDIVEAFKLVGSAQPELLKNSDALAEVTKQALILSNATGLDVNEAVRSLTGSLNQFELGADSASKAIDILSAGSKAGAVEVPKLAEGLKNFGAVANANNVTLQQAVALQETLGEKQIEGAEAGTQLRNIILKLSNAGKGFVNGQFDINEALTQTRDELNAIEDPIQRNQELTKLFGLESVTAGQILLDNIEGFQEYTKAVDETGVAQEQATQRLATVKGAFDFLTISLQNYILGTNESTGASTVLIDVLEFLGRNLDTILNTVLAVGGAFATYRATVIATNVATKAYTAVTTGLALAQRALSGGLKGATTAMKVFNRVTRLNPIGLVVTAVLGAIAVFKAFSAEASASAKAQEAFNKVSEEARKSTAKQKTELAQLVDIAKDNNNSLEDRQKAIEKLNAISPEYLGNLTLENINTAEGTKLIGEYIKALDRKALAQAVQNKKQEFATKLIEEESKALSDQIGVFDQLSSEFQSINSVGDAFTTFFGAGILKDAEQIERQQEILNQKAIENRNENIAKIKEEEKAFDDLVKAKLQSGELGTSDLLGATGPESTTPTTPTGPRGKSPALKRAEEEAKRIQKLNEELQKKITEITNDAEKEREQFQLDNLSGEARVQKELEIRLRELETLESFLLKQNELVESNLEKRAENERRIREGISENIVNIENETNKKILAIREQATKQSLDNQVSLIEERLSGIDIELESNNESINAEREITLLNQKLDLLDQELIKRKAILEAQLNSNDISEEQKEIIRQQIVNLDLKSKQEKQNINQAITELGKAETLQQKFDGFLGNIFGTDNPEEINQVKQSLTQLAQFGAQQFEESVQRQIQANQTLIDRYDQNISDLESRLEEEKQLREQGDANDVERVEQQIRAEQALRNKAVQEQEKLARKQEAINKIRILSELTLAVAQILASEASKGIVGIALAAVAIPALFALFSSAKGQANQATTQLAEGDVLDVKKGNDYKKVRGKSHKDGGTPLLDHVEIEGEESIGVLRKEVSEKDREQWRKITQHLNKKKTFGSFFDYPVVKLGQSKNLVANVTNISSTDMRETNLLLNKMNDLLESQDKYKDLGDKYMSEKGLTRTIRRK